MTQQIPKSAIAQAAEAQRLRRVGEFFKSYRLSAGLTEEQVTQTLELKPGVYNRYEAGLLSMPLEDVFALTNLFNIAPEEVMDLVHSLYMHGAE